MVSHSQSLTKISGARAAWLLAAWLLCGVAPLVANDDLTERLQARLDRLVESQEWPGATLAVVLPDDRLIDLASGLADRQTKAPMQAGARMFCGSTGKTWVSAVALQLVGEGKLDLEARVVDLLKAEDQAWFQKLPNAEAITVRSLMNHTSGLPRYIFQPKFLEDLNENPMRDRSPRENLKSLMGTEPVHDFAQGWSYSDSNYLVLGLLIETVTGSTYYEEAKRRLLDPLKLSDTLPATGPRLEGLIQGHIGRANPFQLPPQTVSEGSYALNPSFEWCGGGYITNARDLARWMVALHRGPVLRPQEHRLLVAPVDYRTGQPAEMGYGLGSFVWGKGDMQSWGHAGIMPGYLTQIEYFPSHRIAIALQVNTDEGMGQQLHGLVGQIAKEIVALPEDAKSPTAALGDGRP